MIKFKGHLAHRRLDGDRVLGELDCIKVLTGLAVQLVGMGVDLVLDERRIGQFAIDGRSVTCDSMGIALE